MHRPRWRRCALIVVAWLGLGCSSPARTEDAATECDANCRTATALRGLRETLKLTYNLALQGQAVGPQDRTTPCPRGGSARITGTAFSEAQHGTTSVDLDYELEECGYESPAARPERSYALVSHGRVHQRGVLAGPPETTTALVLESAAISLSGTVYDPPLEVLELDCTLNAAQTGDQLSGTLCGQDVALEL